ncbi:hypothetical protein [Pseudomonas sp. ok266]|uniref:hypothetical protein n=1 Tax=Pseudomonas sp. ok266 TaxID=1761896 RepID=UPI0008C2A3BD|nr:hypothetical protein [Pseudomonas sp. ok266]SEO71931.1 hypothetical protein SAMN04487856_11037 [Pseudomonas sp. ok266]
MEYDKDAALAKRKQLLSDAARDPAGAVLTEEIRLRLVDAFASITPPEAPEFTIGLITINSLFDAPKARSRKPGNLVLNWRKLLDIVPDVSLAGLGAASLPVAPQVAVVLVGLYIWSKVWRGAVEEFSDIEAVTMLALWKHRNDKCKIAEPEGFVRVTQLRAHYALPPLTLGQYASAINRLVQLDCIELENGIIWLRECIRVKYS